MLDTISRCGSRVEFLGDHRKNYFAVVEVRQPFLACNHLATRRKDGRDAHQILRCDSRVSQSQLKRRQALLVGSLALGEEKFLRTMLFPNSYVSSVSVKDAVLIERSRMSLSHLAGVTKNVAGIHRTLTEVSLESEMGGGREWLKSGQRIDPAQAGKAGKIAIDVCSMAPCSMVRAAS